ncbi:MAG: hypothetical protein ABSD49_06605 [Candidatus Bathyarchaeia archaeon]
MVARTSIPTPLQPENLTASWTYVINNASEAPKLLENATNMAGACLRNPKNVLLGLGLKGSLTWFLAFHFP